MKRFVVGVALTLVTTSCSGDPEPTHGGKPLSYWLRQLLDHDPSVSGPAAKALGRMGSLAVPGLLEQLDNPSYRNKALQTLADMGGAASAAVRGLLDRVEQQQAGNDKAELCKCLSHILKPDDPRSLWILDGLWSHVCLAFDRKDWSTLEPDVRFIAAMPFDHALILRAVKWGSTYHQSGVVKHDCIRALGRGSRWGLAAVNTLGSVLTDGGGSDVKVALDALSMRKNLPQRVVGTLIRIVATPSGVLNPKRERFASYADVIHQRAIQLLKTQGPRLIPMYVTALQDSAMPLERSSEKSRQFVRENSILIDRDTKFWEIPIPLGLLCLEVFRNLNTCRRLANLLRDLGDDGVVELKRLESIPVSRERWSRSPLFPTPHQMWVDALRNVKATPVR